MMLSFPVAFDDFAKGLRTTTLDWDLSESRHVSQNGDGELLVSDVGHRLWGGKVVVTSGSHATQRKTQALLQALRQGAATFYMGDKMAKFPAADPRGTIIGTSVATLVNPVTGSPSISLSGLPINYEITCGDYLSFDYGDGRRGLHQVFIGGRSNENGTISLSVVPQLRPGASNGAVVSLIGATCKALIVPGSVSTGSVGIGGITSGFSFSFRQSLR